MYRRLFLLCCAFSLQSADRAADFFRSLSPHGEIKLCEIGSLYALPTGKKIEVWAPKKFPLTTAFLKDFAWHLLKDEHPYNDHSRLHMRLSWNNAEIDDKTNSVDLTCMLRHNFPAFVFIPDLDLIKVLPHNMLYKETIIGTRFNWSIADLMHFYRNQSPALEHEKLTLVACKKGSGDSKTIHSDQNMYEVLKNISAYSHMCMLQTDQLFW